MFAGGKAADGDGERIPYNVRVEFVVESNRTAGPYAESPRKRQQIPSKALPRYVLGDDRRVAPKDSSDQIREGDDMELLVRGAEASEVVLGQGGEIARVRDIQNTFGAGGIGCMPKSSGLAGTGVSFEKAHRLTGCGKLRLRLGPGPRG